MNAEERREALAEELSREESDQPNLVWPSPAQAIGALVESWVAEKDAEIERLRSVDAAIPSIRADQRRHTAHEIADKLGEFAVARFDEYGLLDARGAALWDAAAHIRERMYPDDEVGGSDE